MVKCSLCDYQQVIKEALFCTNCGNRLIAEAKETAVSDRLKFWGGELRQLTVFFVNFIGFEKFTEKHVYLNAMIYVRECLKEIEERIKNFDGTANQIIPDDRVLGIFGAPRAHHDDPLRAVRCAYQIENWWLKKKATNEFLKDVDITVGVNTGSAFFGYVLKESTLLTVIGDTINTACRIAEIGSPHEILISESTHERVREYTEVEHIGERSVKGKTAKIDVYLLKGIKEEAKVTAAQKTPLFGNEAEIKKLLNIVQEIKKNKLSVCIICGQMGVGKTRLKEEFESNLLKDESVKFIETHCSTQIESPYYPFKFLLRNYFKLNEFDNKEVLARKIGEQILNNGLLPIDVKGIIHLFLTDLRRLRSDEIHSISEEIYTSMKNLIRAECRRQPLILIFEDFNRVDAMSKDLISYLIAELETEPLMLLMVNISKDTLTTIANIAQKLEEISLASLSIKDLGDLIRFMLNDVDDKLIDFIYRTSGGNPLFAIEAIRHTRRTKVIKEVSGRWYLDKEQRLPFLDDLYGVVMSTIDSLPSDYRLIIDYAAVIGYSFGLRILKELFKQPNLHEHLNYLVNEGYIILSKNAQDPVYIFRHNLLKDAAYTVLPLRKRKEIHRQVANLFETLYADQLSSFYENVGHHYLSCDNFNKAANYFKQAGDRAKNLYALDQAFSFYNNVLKIKKDSDNQVPDVLVRDVMLNLTDLYEMTGDIQKMEKIAAEGWQSASKDSDFDHEVIFSERNSYAQILLGQFDKAEGLLLENIHKCQDKKPDILTILYADLGSLYINKDEYERSILYYNLAWNTARANEIKDGEILCLLNLSHLHRNLGNYEQAFDYLNYSLDNLVSTGDVRRIVQIKYLIAGINYQIWNLERAKEMLLEVSTVAETIGSIETYIKSELDLAVIDASNGKPDEAEKYLKFVDKNISFFTRENLLAEINLKKALVFYKNGDHSKAKDFILNALRIAQRFRQKEAECNCYNLLSLVDESRFLTHALKALDIAETLKLPPLIAAALFRLTQIFIQDNEVEKARYYGRKALLVYDDIKTKLKDENRQFYIQRPEYKKLLET